MVVVLCQDSIFDYFPVDRIIGLRVNRLNSMNEPTPKLVTCRCQHCDTHIEFDASGFDEGETASVNCPNCQMDTVIYVPVSPPQNPPDTKPLRSSFTRIFRLSNFERTVFTLIRMFALFWAALMVLALITATINYLRGFPDRDKAPDPNQVSFWQNIFQSHAWQNFGIYALAVLLILFALTMVSFVLLLLAIERNTRNKD